MKKIIKRIIIVFACLYIVIVSYYLHIVVPMITLSYEDYGYKMWKEQEFYNKIYPNNYSKIEGYMVMKARYDCGGITKAKLIGAAFLIPLPPYETSKEKEIKEDNINSNNNEKN